MGRPLQLSMDLLKPYADKPLPAVVFITGGGFLDTPKSKFIGQRVDIARAGYVVASITYRVVPNVTFREWLRMRKRRSDFYAPMPKN